MTHKGRILIVDDEPLNVKLLAAKLPADQYETIWAYNGKEALEKVVGQSPDLILLDIMMPGMNGYEVTRRLKNDTKTRDIPVILVTALGGKDNKIMGLEVGADEFLNKPVNTAELVARVKSLLRLKQYQDQLKARTQSQASLMIPTGGDKSVQETAYLPSILLVEDDDKDARLIQRYLHGQPYRVSLLRDGEETISRAQQGEIDIILLDLLLPGMDGFEVCRRLKEREQTRNIQIVVLTSLRDLKSKIKGLELGADDFLVKPINMHELRVRINALIKKKAHLDELHASYDTAVHSAITDKLTGLYNHAYFKHFLEHEVKRSLRQRHPVALIMIDIDDFKYYNDTLGHLAGDEILRELGKLTRENIREVDLGARYGGEEFAVVLPNTDMKGAAEIAERIRQMINRHPFAPETNLPSRKLTVSMGVATFPSGAESSQELIQNADTALYKAKREGKNRVCVCDEDLPEQK
jgi:two-component system cell cycle response regulator